LRASKIRFDCSRRDISPLLSKDIITTRQIRLFQLARRSADYLYLLVARCELRFSDRVQNYFRNISPGRPRYLILSQLRYAWLYATSSFVHQQVATRFTCARIFLRSILYARWTRFHERVLSAQIITAAEVGRLYRGKNPLLFRRSEETDAWLCDKLCDADTRVAENFRNEASRPACIKQTPNRRKGIGEEGRGGGVGGHHEKNIPGVGHRQLDLAFPIYGGLVCRRDQSSSASSCAARRARTPSSRLPARGEGGWWRALERGREKAGKSSRYLVNIARATVPLTGTGRGKPVWRS